jgi:hypothetical protein
VPWEKMNSKTLMLGIPAVVGALIAVLVLLNIKPSGEMTLRGDDISLSVLQEVPSARWQDLARKRIYFGHKSVGAEILAGLADIQRKMPQIRLQVAHGDPSSLAGKFGIADSSIGANFDPESKMRDFAAKLEAAGPGAVDIAMMKFCYVDIDRNTDVAKIFARYKETIASLEQKLPGTTFIHCTVPMTSRYNSLKAYAKRLLGRAQDSASDNRMREELNAMIRAEYSGRQPVLDIAAVESTLPDGNKVTYANIPCLAACYTYDGGHLNEPGRRAVAVEFLRVLAGLPN